VVTVNRNPSRAELTKFGVTILIGLAVIGGLAWWLGARGDKPQDGWTTGQIAAVALWLVGPVVFLLSSVTPAAGRYVYIGWMSAAVAIGMVVTPVVFTVIFIVLLPIFSLIRLKDPLRLKRSDCPTFWEDPKPHEATLERMRRPF
jgi:hypothetical protein